MPSIFGPLLLGIGKGMQDYDKAQEDLAYTRQTRAQEIQNGNLANQQKQLQIQGLEQQQKDEAMAREQALRAKASSDQTSADLAGVMVGLRNPGQQAPQGPGATLNGAAQPGQQPGLPDAKKLPTSYDAPKNEIPAIDRITTLEKSGVDVTPEQFTAADQNEKQQIQARQTLAKNYRAQAAEYAKQGTPEGNAQAAAKMQAADALTVQAAQLQKANQDMAMKGVELQEKDLKTKDEALKSVRERMRDVTGQKDYSTVLSEIRSNPALSAAARSANLTGDYNQDRPKIAKLVQDTETLAQQQQARNDAARVGLEAQRVELAKRADARAEMESKKDTLQQNIRVTEAKAQDAARKPQVEAKGIPFVPSLESKFPNVKPGDLAKMRAQVNKDRAKAVDDITKGIAATTESEANLTALTGLLKKGVGVGGLSGAPGIRQIEGAFGSLSAEFDKNANNLVVAKQQALRANGGGVSSGTASMARIIGSTKPERGLPEAANRKIIAESLAFIKLQQSQFKFTAEFLRNNPDATKADAQLNWQRYENQLGPAIILDPKDPSGSRVSTKYMPTLIDGSPNPDYIAPESYFKENQ